LVGTLVFQYQISDGVEAAISALPFLLKLCPADRTQAKTILLLVLFDSSNIGEYKRVCDYVIEAIHDGFGKESPDDVRSFFLGYLLLASKFNAYLNKSIPKGQRFHDTNSRVHFLKEFTVNHQEAMEAMALNRLRIAPTRNLQR